MQQSLATHVNELEQLTTHLQERGEVLQSAYEQAQEADRMKIAFLHNMTNQMATPVNIIEKNVKSLSDLHNDKEKKKVEYLITDIQQQGIKVTDLLNHLLKISDQKNDINPS
jgi:methyl-accepting chemotaxis protein